MEFVGLFFPLQTNHFLRQCGTAAEEGAAGTKHCPAGQADASP